MSFAEDLGNRLLEQYRTIEDRLQNPTDSTTSKIVRDSNALVKKVGEECAELIAAIARGDAMNYLEEAQQLAGWLSMVGAVQLGISREDYFKAISKYQKHK